MHYGFSYHFSGNGTFFLQINIVTSIFIENCWNLFYMIDNSQKSMPNIFLIKYDQYLQRYLQKTWRGRHLTLKFCVSTKQTVTWKKVENNNFIWGPLQGANIFQIFSVIIFFKKYLEPDLLGKIQLVPQLPLRGHCNLSEIIKTQENVKGESNMWKKVKLNEQGTPNISSEITLSFENGSESSQFGQILKSELYWRAKPIVHC